MSGCVCGTVPCKFSSYHHSRAARELGAIPERDTAGSARWRAFAVLSRSASASRGRAMITLHYHAPHCRSRQVRERLSHRLVVRAERSSRCDSLLGGSRGRCAEDLGMRLQAIGAADLAQLAVQWGSYETSSRRVGLRLMLLCCEQGVVGDSWLFLSGRSRSNEQGGAVAGRQSRRALRLGFPSLCRAGEAGAVEVCEKHYQLRGVARSVMTH